MGPRVAIDVTAAVTQGAGVGRYVRELTLALAAMPDGPELLPFFVAPGIKYALDVTPTPAMIQRTVRSWRMEILARHLVHAAAHGPWDRAQVYHAPDVIYPPVRRRLPVVTTVLDLSFVVYPHFHTRLNGSYLRLLTPMMTRRAQTIIAISQSTARALIEHMHVPERKIRVVYPAVSATFTAIPPAAQIAEVRQRYGLTEPFILSVGTLEPRKNLTGTLNAYGLLRERLPDAPLLALAGGSGWRLNEADLLKPVDAAHVRRLGFVPDEDLAALYASCSAFVYPSFYEGWGLPVAEALSLGAPTVTSNVSSLPEVAGAAALIVDPHAPEEIAAALERILTDNALAAQLRTLGPAHARKFTLEGMASGTMAAYREASLG